jgi:hypothetical protein
VMPPRSEGGHDLGIMQGFACEREPIALRGSDAGRCGQPGEGDGNRWRGWIVADARLLAPVLEQRNIRMRTGDACADRGDAVTPRSLAAA